MKKIFGLLAIVCLSLPQFVTAQSFDDLFNDFMNQSQQLFNDFENQSRQAFYSFSDSISHVFADAMVANMKTFSGNPPLVKDPKPRPNITPELNKDNVPELPKIERPKITPRPILNPMGDNPTQATPEESLNDNLPSGQFNAFTFDIFGENVSMAKKPFPDKLKGLSVENVRDFWNQLSVQDCQEMLQRCQIAQQHGFNDWAVYQLVLRMVQQIYNRKYDEQVVMTVYLLNQLGLEAKVGFDKSHLFCLIAVEQQLYDLSFVEMEGNKYYFFEINPRFARSDQSELYQTYEIPDPIISTHSLDMNIRKSLRSASNQHQDGADIQINLDMIDLYETYPHVDIVVYANAIPSYEFCKSIEKAFSPYLRTQTTEDAVSLLLAYVQDEFEYASDDDQFGYEKPFFCEENFYFPQNDCEDRSILFSFLVRHLLHLEVVLIDYPEHMATAVHFPTDIDGEFVWYNGKKYVICDPTYLGASIGMEMDLFTSADRKVIPLE